MTQAEVRRQLESVRSSSEIEGRLQRDAQLPLERLRIAFGAIPDDDRPEADSVVVEWLESNDENHRYDAIALIDEFRIVAALPALNRLRRRLLTSRSPGAPFEVEKIDRVLRGLTAGSGDP